ncbi:MAG TPA: chromosomal replication initiator protein DnaA [Aquifex aeolicus]|nr:chromosomal replication initiator protein DnaA [Aquificales bacterium]HIQ26704.1 chromosomal replication initiator protein DnaA [Aquifex aeolicus]
MPGLLDSVLEKLREIYRELESPALREVVERAELEEYEDKVVVRVPDEYCKFAFLKEIYPRVKRKLQVSLLVLTPSEDVIFELSPKYTFKNFIVGKGNHLAVRACQVAIENLRKKSIPYNPIFIYGRVGVGKTHLLQATGNKALERGFKVIYRSSIDFAEEVVNAIKENSLGYLRDFYKTVDVLLIDDIQFMAGKERTQLEFFNIFNHLYQNNKLLVIASDRHPKKLKDVMDRLINRFEGGLVVELKLDEITKKAIIKEKLIIYGLPVDQNIIDYIAQNTGDNVREIEGFITQLKAKESLNLKPSEEKARLVSPVEVVKEVSAFYGVSKNKILKKTRHRKISLVRQIAIYLTRQVCRLPLAKVGEMFGVSDHTSVLYAIRKIEKLKKENPQLGEEIEFLKTKLLEG